ncbi:hypothetical protein Terro_1302 [Terriglobus roseus DSM 18391]|uniref:Uncharacterized protein n=1 Tax=Terriglobus roseus (strain DSM 18391 / NRRL B-41598 / KBS 63) TaxID=926566 RepID=I3ZEE3_TERRK|nr:hypothetical protein [Terriglobus roseus]AFL87611.1 hypothetical protein Terro_1302 [Terriglobus roseus DSM 18391]
MVRSFCVALCLAAATAGVGSSAQTALRRPVPQVGKPMSIITEQKTVQTFAEGLQITRVTRDSFYRDSLGRVLTKSEHPLDGGRSLVTFMLQDLAANESLFWNIAPGAAKEYTQTTLATPTPFVASVPFQQPIDTRPLTKRDNLGEEYVGGFPCQAARMTTTYPIDTVGNDRPFAVVNETCMSREFGRSLKSSVDDPRNGKTTVTVLSISRGEPDPALFQPPADYVRRINVTTLTPAAVANAR